MSKGWFGNKFGHKLASKGIKTKISKVYNINNEPVELPEFLYHGTSFKSAIDICNNGIKIGKDVGISTKEYGFENTTDMFVSLAKEENDAIFFATANQSFENGKIPPQAIIQIDSSKLNNSKLISRPLFDKEDSEFLHLGDVPVDAIRLVKVRFFDDNFPKL